MKNIFIESNNPNLAKYLFWILDNIYSLNPLNLLAQYAPNTHLAIIDIDGMEPDSLLKYKKTPVVIFTYQLSSVILPFTRNLDVRGVISLDMETEDINEILEKTLEGDLFYSDDTISLLFSASENKISEKIEALTKREIQIIKMMMKDRTNEEIANTLKLSVRTVNAHKGNIIKKIGSKTTSGLITKILQFRPTL